MKTCNYSAKKCQETKINEYGLCKKHYFPYSKGSNHFDFGKIKAGFKRLSRNAPEPEADLEDNVMAVLMKKKQRLEDQNAKNERSPI